MKRLSNKNGFTLLEIVIAVSIVALTLAFATPSFQRYNMTQNVKNTARQIYTKLQQSRLTAIKENKNVNVTFTLKDPTSASMTMTHDDGTDALDPVNFTSSFPNVMLNSTQTGVIVFSPRGTINQSQTISAIHSDPGIDTYQVVVNMSGGMRFGKP